MIVFVTLYQLVIISNIIKFASIFKSVVSIIKNLIHQTSNPARQDGRKIGGI